MIGSDDGSLARTTGALATGVAGAATVTGALALAGALRRRTPHAIDVS